MSNVCRRLVDRITRLLQKDHFRQRAVHGPSVFTAKIKTLFPHMRIWHIQAHISHKHSTKYSSPSRPQPIAPPKRTKPTLPARSFRNLSLRPHALHYPLQSRLHNHPSHYHLA